MSSNIKNVIIVGAGGHLGPFILSAFDADQHFTVSILARNSSTSTFPSHLTVHRIDDSYPEASLVSAFQGQDVVVSTIATSSVGVQKKLVDAAIKAGVKRFVPSDFGSDTENEKAMAILPQYFKGKKGTVEYLKEKEKEGKIAWTAFVNGPFFDLALKVGFMGFDLKSQTATIYNDGNGVWSTTTARTIGIAVKNAMLIPETANKYIFINSFNVSQNEVLASLEKATKKKWEATHVDAEEQKKIGTEKVASGDFSGAMLLIRYINCIEGHGGNFAQYEKTSNELLSLPKDNLDDVVAQIVQELSG
ncbi:isoflavone reductase family protein-like protein [Stipitochalara longipes BDJ]|nr:isoflavone reductase family protein-like protein [Stipitochalara longipes BDJ]